MPIRSKDLHGNVPDSSGAALLLIDVVNDFEFEGGEALIDLAMPVGKQIANLKKRAKEAGIPSIYVNDNFGKWQSDLKKIVSRGGSFLGFVHHRDTENTEDAQREGETRTPTKAFDDVLGTKTMVDSATLFTKAAKELADGRRKTIAGDFLRRACEARTRWLRSRSSRLGSVGVGRWRGEK